MTETWVPVTLHGGPLDGKEIKVLAEDPDPGVAMMSDWGIYGPGGRSWYEPDDSGRWVWTGDSA